MKIDNKKQFACLHDFHVYREFDTKSIIKGGPLT